MEDAAPFKPSWRKWSHMPAARLPVAVLLSLDVDPVTGFDYYDHEAGAAHGGAFLRGELGEPGFDLEEANIRVAVASARWEEIASGNISDEVSLSKFAALAVSCGWSLPDEFPRPMASSTSSSAPEPQVRPKAASAGQAGQVSWPWGTHTTELLGHLAAAAQRFWVNYDPTDRTTAPTNASVSAWLVERGVPSSMADKMATILRPDDLPPGPRK
jgi:hypothetical protein